MTSFIDQYFLNTDIIQTSSLLYNRSERLYAVIVRRVNITNAMIASVQKLVIHEPHLLIQHSSVP